MSTAELAALVVAIVAKLEAQARSNPGHALAIIHAEREYWSALAGAPRPEILPEA